MRKRSEMIKLFGFVPVVIIVGIGLGWLGSKNTATHPQTSEAKKSQPLSLQSNEEGNIAVSAKTSQQAFDIDVPNKVNKLPQTTKESIQDGESQISDILGADGDDAEKSRKLIELFPKLPETGQAEAARHLANLVSDENYTSLGTILTNSQTTAEASEILLDDLLNRVNSIKVPLMLAVARDAAHPQTANAKDLLERILGEDYGTNWSEWERMAKVWLEKNPD